MTQAESFSRPDQAITRHASPTDLFASGGEMGEHIRSFDWSTTPLGSVERWPQSLLTLVTTSIRSRFPIVIWWDHADYTTFYNDAYIPVLGKTKHPGWLGRSGKDCWREIWPVIDPMLESVFETGQPTWSEDLLLILDRNLLREETYFTFSYSAIMEEAGSVDGIFCACTGTTARVIGERRLQTLRDLAGSASQARSACDFGIGIAREQQQHLFERFYRVEGDSQLTYPGLGLGLYISAEFIKRHQGAIWVESQPGEGTTVSFSFPLQFTIQT